MQTKTFNSVRQFKAYVGPDVFGVTYRKKNGRFRKAVAQLSIQKNSKGEALINGNLAEDQKDIENDEGVVRYFDWKKDGYRQFSLTDMIVLIVRGKKFNFGVQA